MGLVTAKAGTGVLFGEAGKDLGPSTADVTEKEFAGKTTDMNC